MSGTVTLEPEWFAAERPPGLTAQQPLTEEVEALLNAWLDGLLRQSPVVQPFSV